MDGTVDVERDLRTSLNGLSGLLTSSQSLDATLEQVAELAQHAVPGADGVGVCLFDETGRPSNRMSSSPFVSDLEEAQYRLGEGPCLAAAAERRPRRSGSLGADVRWRRLGPRAGRLGVLSVIAVPLLVQEQVVGVLGIYARKKQAFGDTAERIAATFAGPAAVSVHQARVLVQSRQLAAQLSEALTTRATIDQAIGIIMGQSGSSADEAFERLRAISQREKLKLSQVADKLVAEAVRRARARSRTRETSS